MIEALKIYRQDMKQFLTCFAVLMAVVIPIAAFGFIVGAAAPIIASGIVTVFTLVTLYIVFRFVR